MLLNRKNEIYIGADRRRSLYDITVPNNWNNKLIVFIHGYMGYKDWGCWNLVEDFFTQNNYGFLKYNVSHNGGTVDNPIDFPDLEAFSKNSYVKELIDFECIMDVTDTLFEKSPEVYLIGHSRGGGIALLQSDNGKVQKISTWASISSLDNRFPKGDELNVWEQDGLYFRKNGRTNQQMPHDYSQYESYLDNRERLDIRKYCEMSLAPTLVLHGEKDESVNIREGQELAQWLDTDLIVIPNAQHTFGSKQPWESEDLPQELEQVCQLTLQFFNETPSKEMVSIDVRNSLLSDLVKLAKTDSDVRAQEFEFLSMIATQLGVSQSDFKIIFEDNIEFQPPKLEVDRIIQFQRLILLMNIDLEVSDSELNFVRDLGIRMGLHHSATDEVILRMNNYPNHIIPAQELINIFRTFHN